MLQYSPITRAWDNVYNCEVLNNVACATYAWNCCICCICITDTQASLIPLIIIHHSIVIIKVRSYCWNVDKFGKVNRIVDHNKVLAKATPIYCMKWSWIGLNLSTCLGLLLGLFSGFRWYMVLEMQIGSCSANLFSQIKPILYMQHKLIFLMFS
jgi:hypothetical protein